MGKIAGTIIKEYNIINKSLLTLKLNQGFVFIPYDLNPNNNLEDLKDKAEFIQLRFDSQDETETFFTFNVNGDVSCFNIFEEKHFKDFFDKLDIHLIKMGAKKYPDTHIIEDFKIPKLNIDNIKLNMKLKKIKRYNA